MEHVTGSHQDWLALDGLDFISSTRTMRNAYMAAVIASIGPCALSESLNRSPFLL